MKRAIIMAMLASTLLTGLAAAQPSGGHAPKAAKGEEGGATARSMDAPYLAVPVVRDGQLMNYLFVSIRVEINPGVDLWQTREKAHLLRDALVRASHTTSLADARDNNTLNQARAIQVYRAVAAQVLGERAVGPVSIISSYSSRGSGPSATPR
jgi:hypothetical protein